MPINDTRRHTRKQEFCVRKKDLHAVVQALMFCFVAGTGFEPVTFGL
jgi:hypothetical protein